MNVTKYIFFSFLLNSIYNAFYCEELSFLSAWPLLYSSVLFLISFFFCKKLNIILAVFYYVQFIISLSSLVKFQVNMSCKLPCIEMYEYIKRIYIHCAVQYVVLKHSIWTFGSVFRQRPFSEINKSGCS